MTKTKPKAAAKSKSVSPERRKPPPENQEQMRKNWSEMVSYILMDASEKAEEVDVKTEEEFQLLKKEYFNKMKEKIDTEYDKKLKKSSLEVDIHDSQTHQKMKMDILRLKKSILDELQAEVSERIKADIKNEQRYANILYLLIMEGLFQLMEHNVYVRCRKKDTCLVAALLPHCKEIYRRTALEHIYLHVDIHTSLPETCLGGIQLTVMHEKICIENTLDTRLGQIMGRSVPAINACMFEKKLHTLQL